MTSYVNITEEATDAEGTTSTTCLTSHSNVTEKATTTAAVHRRPKPPHFAEN
jgi:hypothetical protein